jgi:hypothetical protein
LYKPEKVWPQPISLLQINKLPLLSLEGKCKPVNLKWYNGGLVLLAEKKKHFFDLGKDINR